LRERVVARFVPMFGAPARSRSVSGNGVDLGPVDSALCRE
jgi:hypothetical protein